MANLAAKDPNYSGPDVATRLGGPRGPALGTGRPKREWIRKRLNRYGKDGTAADTELEQILDHQIEVAKSWDVRIVGRDSDGTPIKVASGRDSTEAAKFLCGLVGLGPEDVVKVQLALADHFLKVELEAMRFARDLLGDKAKTMSPNELAEFFSRMAPNVRAYLDMAEAVKNEQTASQPQQLEPAGQNPSPKDRDTADHGPADSRCCDGELSASPPAERTEAQPSAANVDNEAGTLPSEDK